MGAVIKAKNIFTGVSACSAVLCSPLHNKTRAGTSVMDTVGLLKGLSHWSHLYHKIFICGTEREREWRKCMNRMEAEGMGCDGGRL